MFKKKSVCPKLSYRLKDRGKKKSILTKLHAKSPKKKKCSTFLPWTLKIKTTSNSAFIIKQPENQPKPFFTLGYLRF